MLKLTTLDLCTSVYAEFENVELMFYVTDVLNDFFLNFTWR